MIFRRATLKLTITYTVVQLALFAIFAVGIYSFVTGTFVFEGIRSAGEAVFDPTTQGAELLLNGLIIFYLGLVVVVPLSSWLMARAALKPVRESYEQQQQFVDGASHEMRTPLSVIQGELELALTRSRSAAEYRDAITVALDATVGLSRLTDDLLKLSRTPKEALSADFTGLDLDNVIEGAISGLARQARVAGISVNADPHASVHVRGSRELLTRAVGNLVENAIKFSEPGGRVTVSATRAEGRAAIRVADDGVGMSRDEQTHAFERFWRADAARTTPGHGLGLALVAQIMDAHSGSVSLRSEAGSGTVVTLAFPVSGP